MAMAPPRRPPPLIDDVLTEIFLRLPPDEPEHLFRAALVCKPWLRILCDAGFLRRYRAFHGAPPLLGFLHGLQPLHGTPYRRFTSTTSMPDLPYAGFDDRRTRPLDCRHGRFLIFVPWENAPLHVWDPVAGDRHAVPWPAPDIDPFLIESATVLCATDGCDHLDCHGGPFRLFLATHEHKDAISAWVYSSETGAWSVPVSFDSNCESSVVQQMHAGLADEPIPFHIPNLQPTRGALVGGGIYFTIRFAYAIVKYDWGKNALSVINSPSRQVYHISLMAMDNSTLGFAFVLGSILCTWSRKVDTEEAAEWVAYRVIDLEKIIPIVNPDDNPTVVGFAEGVGVVFVSTDAGLFTIKLSSGKAKMVDDTSVCFSVVSYMSFYTPDRGRLLSLARAQ